MFFFLNSCLFYRKHPYQSMRLKKCPIDIKLALFCIFSVGLVTIDLGSDSAQGNSYIEEGNYYWGYSTISLMFVPLISVCTYVILSRRVQLWENEEGIWWDSFLTISRHIPFVQPFVHFYYLYTKRGL